MRRQDLKKLKLPDKPGVYFFMGGNGKILYIGKATSLRERVCSYFGGDLANTRGSHIASMVKAARAVKTEVTDSVLEALILESTLIKKWKPKYNTEEKDDKSFNYIIITKENFPRVFLVRGRELGNNSKKKGYKYQAAYGPFPKGGELREALKIIRKIFPFRDNCQPGSGRPCFNRQIGLCPGVCSGEISQSDYSRHIGNLKLFLGGRKREVIKNLEKEMKSSAKTHDFELAGDLKKRIFSLKHIQDIALLKRETIRKAGEKTFRIEAYDVAHLSGKQSVAVMTVIEDGLANKNEYRKFKLRLAGPADDLSSLEEVLRRRFNHPEWRMPDLVVVDGGVNQKNRAEKTIKESGVAVPIVAVVKDEKHRPRDILGDKSLKNKWDKEILLGNSEAHRFAITYHRLLRNKNQLRGDR